ncbi:MAG: hypothetical protein ACK4NZ_02755 [Tsuneonella sp.]
MAMRTTILLPLVLLAACGSADDGTAPGDVTESEAKALDEAASMLDERRVSSEVLPEGKPSATPTSEPKGESE